MNKWRLSAGIALLAAACAAAGPEPVPFSPIDPEDPSFVRHFAFGHDPIRWRKVDFPAAAEVQNVAWDPGHVGFDGDAMVLSIAHDSSSERLFRSGEYQRQGYFQYGRYEAVMKAAEGSGLLTAFFAHREAGPGADQISLEILGRDPWRAHLVYFTEGERGVSRQVDLPFNAADAFHLYAFEWSENGLKWFAGEQLLFETTTEHPSPPSRPAAISASLWAGQPELQDWLGAATFASGARAAFRCISYTAPGSSSERCADFHGLY